MRRTFNRRAAVLAACAVLAALALFVGTAAAGAKPAPGGVAMVVKAIDRIESKSLYRQSDWGYAILDRGVARCSPRRTPTRCSTRDRR
jgi:hypothetical protein